MFPNQDSFRFRHTRECTLVPIYVCVSFRTVSLFPRRVLSGLFSIFGKLVQRQRYSYPCREWISYGGAFKREPPIPIGPPHGPLMRIGVPPSSRRNHGHVSLERSKAVPSSCSCF